MNIWKHFCTINHHKMLVMRGCFQVGLIKQGLLHDLSKYSPTEFIVGCKYYQGNMSPNNAEREAVAFSTNAFPCTDFVSIATRVAIRSPR